MADVPIAVATKSLIAEINSWLDGSNTSGLPPDMSDDASSPLATALPALSRIVEYCSGEDTSEGDAPKGFRESFRRGIVFEFKFEDD